jgi:hypothetical protein
MGVPGVAGARLKGDIRGAPARWIVSRKQRIYANLAVKNSAGPLLECRVPFRLISILPPNVVLISAS